MTGADHLAERTLFKGRRIVVHLDGEYTYRSGGAYAHTLVAYNITMKPAKPSALVP